MRVRKVILAASALAVSALLAAGLATQLGQPPAAPPAWAGDYDVTAGPPEMIAPGTVVEQGPPKGWSHLVVKSLPRVRESEKARVPAAPLIGRDLTVRMAGWMFTAFAADVTRESTGPAAPYRLRAIGLGLGAQGTNGDTVVTSETALGHGVKMDWIKRQVLDTGYKIQGQAVIPVRGPSFALLDTPVIVRCGDRNRMVRYRYALLADTGTGALDVLLWVLGAESGECSDLTRVVQLEPNCVDRAELIPDPKEFSGPRPSDLSFAVDKLPPHRLEIVLPPELRERAAQTRFAPDEARSLEVALRKLTAGHRP
ncbi:hypothetical protein GobsT_57490 [Gemmata obscuriglobus]|uniref:Uncharacterized protein n=1 Tax=Gemmata obscuriglobus TaxID=114 RepID=A0A2Z3GY66_9BACT|nr:hypothetical protein [Gemmata obscuriglobus]AWM36447.1 hypothetical protein C1280_05040 [Gemmata obscuriglobus]QEG30931.1 hypothetical protein GobsT_57490 [Gemmata obscuriglobus]VTS10264.1 Uncharacterized protein OS=Singulisphaera acidiphila (strain ATCC BAA-1392 / DSM 18658 / VKM B-2454 / MOB10) GN=Sinac_4667 PE=4 SV=1 [Gemmata obscuriglobus UQM 2246]